jgi:hypothetical protein
MKTRLFPALLLAATLAAPVFAQTPASQPPPAPAVIAQLEIRGIAPLFEQASRLLAPFVPPQQVDAAVKGFLSGSCPVDLLALVGADSSEPLRAVVYAKPGTDTPGVMLDLPAANGDIDAFFDVIARSCPSSAIPPAIAAHLPLSARMYTLPTPVAGNNPERRVLFLPHGSRVAVWPLALRGPASPIQATRLLSSFAPIGVEGAIAVRADLAAIADLAGHGRGSFIDIATDAADFRDLPFTDYAVGFGLDAANRIRFDNAYVLRGGTAVSRFYSSFGAPAPFVNAVLAPDAIAAAVHHADYSLAGKSFFDEFLNAMDDDFDEFKNFLSGMTDLVQQMADLYGNDSAYAVYPPAGGKTLPWAACTARGEALDSLDTLSDRFSALAKGVLDLAAAFAEQTGANGLDGLDIRIDPTGDRTVADTAIRSYTVRATAPDDGASHDLFSFDAALAGPALVLANLPDDRLSDVVSALASGDATRPGIDALPSFSAAYGDLPTDACASVFQLLPLLRGVLAKIKEFPVPDNFDDDLAPFLDATKDIVLPLAVVIRPGDAPGSIHETISLPLADLHATINAVLPLAMGASPSTGE